MNYDSPATSRRFRISKIQLLYQGNPIQIPMRAWVLRSFKKIAIAWRLRHNTLAFPVRMTDAFSMGAFGSYNQARPDGICRTDHVLRQFATIASFAGGGLGFGTG